MYGIPALLEMWLVSVWPKTAWPTPSRGRSSAAFSVCHDRLAHFTRTGNSDTPENTASLPRVSASSGGQRPGHQLVEPLEQRVGFLRGSCP